MPELPAPLPPAERTVGQLIGESIRFYGGRFWTCLALGVPLAVATQASLGGTSDAQTLVLLAFSPVIAATFVQACRLVLGAQPTRTAYIVAWLVFLPVPVLVRAFILPSLAWLALFGLAVPAAMVEKLRFRAALERGRRLGLADFVHAFGSLCALVIVVVVSDFALVYVLRSQGDNGQRVAHALGDLVLSPLLFLGGALLYVDQAARVVSSRGDASLHPALDADAAGHTDPQVES